MVLGIIYSLFHVPTSEALHRLGGEGGGVLARSVTADAVEDEVKAEIRPEGANIFVDRAPLADLGASAGFDVKNSRQECSPRALRVQYQVKIAALDRASAQRVGSLTRRRTAVMLSGPPSSLARSTRRATVRQRSRCSSKIAVSSRCSITPDRPSEQSR